MKRDISTTNAAEFSNIILAVATRPTFGSEWARSGSPLKSSRLKSFRALKQFSLPLVVSPVHKPRSIELESRSEQTSKCEDGRRLGHDSSGVVQQISKWAMALLWKLNCTL